VAFDLTRWWAPRLAAVDRFLGARYADAWPEPFGAALAYPLGTGGKRVRPALCVAAYEACGGRELDLAVPAAAAFELVHTYSLVHDDLPAMDDADERRGRPSVHKAFDEATAVLVGDALLTDAFQVLADAPLPAETRIALVARLAHAAGHAGMVGGQAADVGLGARVGDVGTLQRLHAGKTGALIAGATVAGGLVAGADADALARLERYGAAVGLAFQLADDVLDADEDSGDDGPPSYVRLLGVDETRRRAHALRDAALDAVAPLDAEPLRALARFIVDRDH
jgi:geranylgeranyl diphosphate synthase type II